MLKGCHCCTCEINIENVSLWQGSCVCYITAPHITLKGCKCEIHQVKISMHKWRQQIVGCLKAWHCHVVGLVCKSWLLQGLSQKLVPLHICSRTIWRSHCLRWPLYVLVPINAILFIRIYNTSSSHKWMWMRYSLLFNLYSKFQILAHL